MGLIKIGQKFSNKSSAHPLFTDPKAGRQSIDEVVISCLQLCVPVLCYFTQFKELTHKIVNQMNAFVPSK